MLYFFENPTNNRLKMVTCSKYAREKPALSADTLEDRAIVLQEWTEYKTLQHEKDLLTIDKMEYSRTRALDQLLQASPFLYEEAVKVVQCK